MVFKNQHIKRKKDKKKFVMSSCLLLIVPLHCTALHCTALHCTALHCTALWGPIFTKWSILMEQKHQLYTSYIPAETFI
jgi:hypothetical protein